MNSKPSSTHEHDESLPLAVRIDAAVPDAPVDAPDFLTGRRPNRFILAWRKIGVGSLAFSLAIHAGLIVVAGIIVFT